MFAQEIDLYATHQHVTHYDPALQLYRGLKVIGEPETETKAPFITHDRFELLLETWDAERLAPSTCNLRSVVLMSGGKRTGKAGLAQETRPANGTAGSY